MKKILLSAILLTGMVSFAQEPEKTETDTINKDGVEATTQEDTLKEEDSVKKEEPAIRDESTYGEPAKEENNVEN